MTGTLTLKDLAQLAAVLDGDDFTDGVAPAQRRALRDAADAVAATFDEVGGVTSAVVLALLGGAALEAQMAQAANPLNSMLSGMGLPTLPGAGVKSPSVPTMMILAFLARDVLAGERVR